MRAGESSQAATSGGTADRWVIRCLATAPKTVPASGEPTMTILAPAWIAPSTPGELIVKLCETGRTTPNTDSGDNPLIRALSRTE